MIFDIYNPYVEGLDNHLKSCGDNDSFYLEYSQISWNMSETEIL